MKIYLYFKMFFGRNKKIEDYNIFDSNNKQETNIDFPNNHSLETKNIVYNDQITDNNIQLVELKVREYEENNFNFIIELQNIIGKRKYKRLSFNEKYIIIRYLLEDIDNHIKDSLITKSKIEQNKFIKYVLKYYNKNIQYTGNNLNELDYYYATPFTFFLNAGILYPKHKEHYTESMLNMIHNRINKSNELWGNNDTQLNDLEVIKQRVNFYKKVYPDIYQNIKKSFENSEFELMSFSQKCALLRVVIDGILRDEYNNFKSKELQKRFILKINKIYENISKLNNFSYDWFITVYYRFEDHIKIQKLIDEYEKNNNKIVIDIINFMGNEQYNNLSLVKKYALLKCYCCEAVQKVYLSINDDEIKKEFFLNIYSDIKKYFFNNYFLNDIEDVSNTLIEIYSNEFSSIDNDILENNEQNNQNYSQNQQQITQSQNQQQITQSQNQQQITQSQNQQQIMQQQMMQQANQQQMTQQQMMQQQMMQQANQQQMTQQQMMQQQMMQQADQQQMIQQQMMQQQSRSTTNDTTTNDATTNDATSRSTTNDTTTNDATNRSTTDISSTK